MKNRSIQQVIPSQKVNMGGHILEQPLPNQSMGQLDPFLLVHHAEFILKGDQRPQDVGIGGHPHRGFSPVTFIFKGDVRHQDSFGNTATVNEGGTQWMHAGKGIIHSERPSAAMAEKGGIQEIIQFWVNSPSQYKMEKPYYLPLSAAETPSIEGDGYQIQVVAGDYKDIKGPAKTFSPMLLLRGEIESGSSVDIEIPTHFNTLMYLLDGNLEVNGETVNKKDLVWFKNDGESIQISGNKKTRFIILSGEPIGEKVTSYGPFVMNTQTEIMQAMRDAQMGKMGILIEDFDDVVQR
jgi:redox-sensitive bicupin YhaK (pirin superfamily)